MGIVLARAIARDLHSGAALARFFAVLMLVNGLAPILAPIVGAQLLHVTDWRGVFVVLAGLGVAAARGRRARRSRRRFRRERRHGGGLAATGRAFAELLSDRRFVGYVLSCGLVFAAMFAYIAGSPFVLQEIHGLSAQSFSLVFGANAAGIMAMSAVSGRLGGPHRPRTAARRRGSPCRRSGPLVLLVSVLADAGLAGVLVGPLPGGGERGPRVPERVGARDGRPSRPRRERVRAARPLPVRVRRRVGPARGGGRHRTRRCRWRW